MATPTALPEPDLTGDTRVPAKPLKYIKFEISTFIARLTMSHAPHNVLTVPMMKEMAEAIESLNGRADACDLVSGDGHADAAAADQDSEIGAMLGHIVAYQSGVVGIIHRTRRVRAFILHRDSLLLQMLPDPVFQLEAGVVRTEGDFHGEIVRKQHGRSSRKCKGRLRRPAAQE